MRLSVAAAAALVILAAGPALAERPTARASGAPAVRVWPATNAAAIDRLSNGERVWLERCTREARWCLVRQRDGGPSGWVLGSYLVGSPAKVEVTPFEFSFDPLDPLDLFNRRN